MKYREDQMIVKLIKDLDELKTYLYDINNEHSKVENDSE